MISGGRTGYAFVVPRMRESYEYCLGSCREWMRRVLFVCPLWTQTIGIEL